MPSAVSPRLQPLQNHGASRCAQGRNGKHRGIVTTILKDLDALKAGSAIKVPLAELAESKEKVRSALNRATRKAGRKVANRHRCDFSSTSGICRGVA